MSRYGRRSGDDLAYGDENRWTRDRFDRVSRPEPPHRFEEEYQYYEQDAPGRRETAVEDRMESRGSRGHYEERDRIFRETFGDRVHRRSDRALFGDVDPREIADMAMTPYKSKGGTREDIEINIKEKRRPGVVRRQSSLDTFDRRPIPRYDRDEYRMQPYTPIPLPIRRRDDIEEEYRERDGNGYQEIEVKRERSVHRRSGKKLRAATIKSTSPSSSSSSSEETIEEKISRRGTSPMRNFKKGKTRMPKRLVFREAIMDLGYPYYEEDNFFVLQVALEKDQIDEVIKISETYKAGGRQESMRYEERTEESASSATKIDVPERMGREEIIRKEYINPPSDFLGSDISRRSRSHRRIHSPSVDSSISQRSPARSRARSEFVEERKTVVESGRSRSRAPTTVVLPAEVVEERKTIIEERAPSLHSGALIIQERESRSDHDIQAEIFRLQAERRRLRHEREGEGMQVVQIREERPEGELYRSSERERSPPRNVIRVEKDRKARRDARIVAAAIGTLT